MIFRQYYIKPLSKKIKTSLHQTGKEGEAADGMDMAFCIFNKNTKTLQFSGAYNPLLFFRMVNLKNTEPTGCR